MDLIIRNQKTHVATGGKPFDTKLPCVLFVHGSGLDHRGWALQARWFSHHGFSVLAPDLPGHSLSQGDALTSIEDMGVWLNELLDVAGIQSAHVVGHSQGYIAALELAKNNPTRIKSLTGIGTAAAIPVNPALIETAQKSAVTAAEMMLNWGFGPAAHMGMSAVPGMQPIAMGRQIMRHNPLAQDLQACADYKGGDAIAETLRMPTHLILASADKMTPLKAGKALAQKLNITPDIIENYGHMLPIEAPQACLESLSHFIQAVENNRK